MLSDASDGFSLVAIQQEGFLNNSMNMVHHEGTEIGLGAEYLPYDQWIAVQPMLRFVPHLSVDIESAIPCLASPPLPWGTGGTSLSLHHALVMDTHSLSKNRLTELGLVTKIPSRARLVRIRIHKIFGEKRTMLASFSISHVNRPSLGLRASACADSTACACDQSACTTASFIAAFERVCVVDFVPRRGQRMPRRAFSRHHRVRTLHERCKPPSC
jgi:hypothetical protein